MIPESTPAIVTYLGDDISTNFAITFPTYEDGDVVAEIVRDSDGDVQLMIIATDYLLTSIGRPNTNAQLALVDNAQEWIDAGTLKIGYTLNIKFSTDALQAVRLRDLGRRAPENIEKALDRLTMYMKAVSYLANRAITIADGDVVITPVLPPLAGNEDKILQANADASGFTFGPTATAIFIAEANAIAAEVAAELALAAAEAEAVNALASADSAAASELAAASSETAAGISEVNAAASETLSEFWANIELYVEVVEVDNTDSPVTVVAGPDEGKLYICDDSAGNIIINLPAIGATGLAWKIGVLKGIESVNSITVVPNGTDTVNGNANVPLTIAGIGVVIYADSPTDWIARYFTSAGNEGGGGGGGGGGGIIWNNTTQDIAAAGTITILPNIQQGAYVAGLAGPQTASTTPFGVVAPAEDGTIIQLVGTDDANYLHIPFADIAYGCMLKGDMYLRAGSTLTLSWNATKLRYVPISRID